MLGGLYMEDDDHLLLFTYPSLNEQHYGFLLHSSQWTGFGLFKVFGYARTKTKSQIISSKGCFLGYLMLLSPWLPKLFIATIFFNSWLSVPDAQEAKWILPLVLDQITHVSLWQFIRKYLSSSRSRTYSNYAAKGIMPRKVSRSTKGKFTPIRQAYQQLIQPLPRYIRLLKGWKSSRSPLTASLCYQKFRTE